MRIVNLSPNIEWYMSSSDRVMPCVPLCRMKRVLSAGWGKIVLPARRLFSSATFGRIPLAPQKMVVVILLSYWGGLFSGAMLVSGRVTTLWGDLG